MTTTITSSENILNEYKYQECIHDYIILNSQNLSKNVTETEYICLNCADIRFVYSYQGYEI